MDPRIDRETKLNALLDRMTRVLNIFGEVIVKRYEASLNFDYLELPMLLREQEQTQDLDNEQDMYDAQESIEDEEEGDQEIPDFLPISCIMLIREYHDQIEKANRERCFGETRNYLEDAESDVERESAHIGTSPLDYNSSLITQEEWQPDHIEEITHEPCILIEYHHDHEELFETERDQETSENPQGFPTSTSEDLLEEAQEETQPPNPLIQETESCYTSAQRNTRKSSPLTEE